MAKYRLSIFLFGKTEEDNLQSKKKPQNTLNTLIIVHKTLKILKKASQTSAVMMMSPSPKGHAE
jgi:hypothetical protein